MTTDKPFLFLDIDGTVLAHGVTWDAAERERQGRLPAHAAGLTALDFAWTSASGTRDARIYMDEAMLADIRRLADAYDIVWASSWQSAARLLDAALGIQSHYCLVPPRGDITARKGQAINAFLDGWNTHHYGEDRPDPEQGPVRARSFAWADDDEDWDEDMVTAKASKLGVEMLRVFPDSKRALTHEQVEQMLSFAERVSS